LSKTRKANVRKRLREVDSVIDTLVASGVECKQLDLVKVLPREGEMVPRDKYTTFSRTAKKHRKGVHKVPHFTKRPIPRTTPTGTTAGRRHMDYSGWTKEALIARLRELEQPGQREKTLSNEETQAPSRKKQRRAAEFDFSRFAQRKIALKFSYFGWPYHGLAQQGSLQGSEEKQRAEEQYPTVEGALFRALAKCKLIADDASCGYSRCGRTDRGVSALGQVAALYVRSNGRFLDEGEEAEGAVTQVAQNGGRRVLLPATGCELPYASMLNKNLPPEIRVLA
ncbi:pseudouridine synthase deg1, partial [Coemansia sp. RSA 2703]